MGVIEHCEQCEEGYYGRWCENRVHARRCIAKMAASALDMTRTEQGANVQRAILDLDVSTTTQLAAVNWIAKMAALARLIGPDAIVPMDSMANYVRLKYYFFFYIFFSSLFLIKILNHHVKKKITAQMSRAKMVPHVLVMVPDSVVSARANIMETIVTWII